MATRAKKRASTSAYRSPNQMTFVGFESPFTQELDPTNRWILLANLIPWDEICNLYLKQVGDYSTGRRPLNPRIVLGSLIIKHLCNLDDRETVDQIRENIYMQYFLGYSSFTTDAPFDASLFVEFRKKLGMESLKLLNEKIVSLKTKMESSTDDVKDSDTPEDPPQNTNESAANKGRVLFDATACPQDIAYPTDLKLLADAREKSEEIIDILFKVQQHSKKPRTYRDNARKRYLEIAQKRNKTRKEIRLGVGRQLRFLKRNLKTIDKLLDTSTTFPLKQKEQRYLMIIHTLYQQQQEMYDKHVHSIEDRIVSIHQPHVRPIVRGKSQAKVEFGAKIHVSLIDGFSFLDELSWDAYNEGSHMMEYVEQYKKRFGFYPREVLADQIYCTRENRRALKEKNINLIAKPLGRPSAVKQYVRPGQRNPIEGKFGQAKTGYGLDKIKARQKDTSQSWIACIILVLNLVKLAGIALPYHILNNMRFSFSAISKKITQAYYYTKIANVIYFVGNFKNTYRIMKYSVS